MPHEFLDAVHDKVHAVSEYLELLNQLMKPLKVFVEGEVTDLKVLPQWVFFALKDADTGALLRCGMHSGVYRRIGVTLEEGMMVKVEGYGKIAEKSGNFGFWVSSIEPVGEGALRRAYELLVKKLTEEGVFARKRELPSFISHIGVISSRNGVVLQDLRQNLRPLGIKIDFVHSGVEGADSAGELEAAVRFLTTKKDAPQVLVLIRGGGSLESLQGFNNEAVVRALYAAPMPVLVGIGHDVDAPIATMVADWSASTPTAVAHVINESWKPLTQRVPQLSKDIVYRFQRRLRDTERTAELSVKTTRHAVLRILARFREYERTLRAAWIRIPREIERSQVRAQDMLQQIVLRQRAQLQALARRVDESARLISSTNPERVLARGYGLVYKKDGSLLRTATDAQPGDNLETRLAHGRLWSEVEKVETDNK